MRRKHTQKFRIILPRRFTGKILCITYIHRIIRVQSNSLAILHKDAWSTIGGCRHDIRIIEANICRIRLDHTIPILLAGFIPQSEMPFSYYPCLITRILKHISNGITFGSYNHGSISRCNAGSLPTPGILSCQQGITRRSTCSSRTMSIRKTNSFGSQSFHIGRTYSRSSVTTQIPITDIIGINKQHIRTLRQLLCKSR